MTPPERAAHARFAPSLGTAFELVRRDRGWLALARDVVGFAADDDAGWRRLTSEAWLLARWRAAGVPAPRVIDEDPARGVQIRERMHGLTGEDVVSEPERSRLFDGALPDPRARIEGAPLSTFGERVAASYGELAARIRRAVPISDARAAGFTPTSRRTLDLDAAIARLHATTASQAAKATAARLRPWLAALPPIDAVIHGDLHFFNMCLADDGEIIGVFDVGDAGLDAAATELLYIHSLGARFAAIALDAYGPIDREAVERAHLRTALDHLIWHPPGTPRHASIVVWATAAFERMARP
ncbi:MAG TPA: phosphotransferase [Kofleriaceae bacterium]|nr:phosphotransferase [Kofleriaceae bacterium]